MSRQLRDGLKAVAAAGTAERLTATDIEAEWLRIQANSGNTGDMVVGDSTVVAAAGTRRGLLLSKSTTVLGPFIPGPINLYDIWIDSLNNGDECNFIYLER